MGKNKNEWDAQKVENLANRYGLSMEDLAEALASERVDSAEMAAHLGVKLGDIAAIARVVEQQSKPQ